jgi:RNA polymerase sigma factor (sigma-70 family)
MNQMDLGAEMRDDPVVIALVGRARDSDQTAWNQIVERFAPPVWSICRRYRLSDADSNDVGQNVSLRLVEHLPSLREAAALSGWLTTTTRRECLRAQRGSWDREREPAESTADIPADEETTQVDRVLIDSEPNSALREGLRMLESRCQKLLRLLMRRPADRLHTDQRRPHDPDRQDRSVPGAVPGDVAARPGGCRPRGRRGDRVVVAAP